MINIIDIKNSDILAEKLAKDIAKILSDAVAEKGRANLVVSGGSTPKPLFEKLSKINIDWAKVEISLADERCVEPGSDQSNSRLVKTYLLKNAAARAKYFTLFKGDSAPEGALKAANETLISKEKYDVVILGMGGDGHTASIFPEASNRDEALDPNTAHSAILVDPVTVTPLRITQTAKRLSHSNKIILHIVGDEKANLTAEILANPNPQKWPISFFLTQTFSPIDIYQSSSKGA